MELVHSVRSMGLEHSTKSTTFLWPKALSSRHHPSGSGIARRRDGHTMVTQGQWFPESCIHDGDNWVGREYLLLGCCADAVKWLWLMTGLEHRPSVCERATCHDLKPLAITQTSISRQVIPFWRLLLSTRVASLKSYQPRSDGRSNQSELDQTKSAKLSPSGGLSTRPTFRQAPSVYSDLSGPWSDRFSRDDW